MDRGRMDADRGLVGHRDRRGRKLAVVVAVQNLLVAACLAVTLYVYWDVNKRKLPSGDSVHIQVESISDILRNKTLSFGNVQSSNKMSLVGKDNNTIHIGCTGPYILYVDVNYMSAGTLQLQVLGSETPVHFALNASDESVHKGFHSIAYLRAKDEVRLHLYAADKFKVKSVIMGLSYLLSARECDH